MIIRHQPTSFPRLNRRSYIQGRYATIPCQDNQINRLMRDTGANQKIGLEEVMDSLQASALFK